MAGSRESQYLSFSVGDTLYALPVAKVGEVLETTKITKLPGSDGTAKGIIDLRGQGVPIFDLRPIFGYPESELEHSTIIIVEVGGEEGRRLTMGVLADSVEEVIDIDGRGIEPPPKYGAALASDLICGLARRNDKFVIIIDIDAVLGRRVLSDCGATTADAVGAAAS
jgi:purine-binding chemotaxis protein CheW